MIAFIPARGGSKSIPDKNIKELCGKPLIAWSIELALQAGLRTIVNTDSKKIANIADYFGAEIMMRPSELAKDDTPMYEVLRSEIFKIVPVPEEIMLLQPTTPFRKQEEIEKAIELFHQTKCSSLIAVERVPEKYNPAQ